MNPSAMNRQPPWRRKTISGCMVRLGKQQKERQMKTLVTIGSNTYITSEADLSKLLTLCRTLTRVNERVIYGPGEKTATRYDEELGYRRALVLDPEPERLKIEVLPDGEVLTVKQFERLAAETEQRNAEWSKQPENLSRVA